MIMTTIHAENAFENTGTNRLRLDAYPDNEISFKMHEALDMHCDEVLR